MSHQTSPSARAVTARRLSMSGTATAACCVVLVACTSGAPRESATASAGTFVPAPPTRSRAPTPTASPDLLGARTQTDLSVPGGPEWPIGAFGSLWLVTPDSDKPSVTRVDPATNVITASVPVGSGLCQALGSTGDSIWACARDGLVRIDPETTEITARVEFPIAQYFGYLPYGAGSLWVLTGQVEFLNKLVRVDPVKERVVDTYELDFDATWMSYGEDALWLSDTAAGKLWRFDPATGDMSEHRSGLVEPGPSAIGAGSIWLAVNASRDSRPAPTDVTLLRISVATGDVEAEFMTGGSIFDGMIHAGEDAVWVRATKPFLSRIDPTTNQVTDAFDASRLGGSVTVAYGSVWVTSYPLNRVWRLTP